MMSQTRHTSTQIGTMWPIEKKKKSLSAVRSVYMRVREESIDAEEGIQMTIRVCERLDRARSTRLQCYIDRRYNLEDINLALFPILSPQADYFPGEETLYRWADSRSLLNQFR